MNAAAAMRRSWPWLLLGIVALAILITRLQLSFDISAFFPHTRDLHHEVLLRQFQSGPGSRLIVVGINGADEDQLAEASDELKEALAGSPLFTAVLNGESTADTVEVPEPVASYYLLMQDIDFSAGSLRAAVMARLQDLALGGGTTLLELIARDPYLVTLEVLQRLAPVEIEDEMWFAEDGSAVLMVETRATAVDIAGQGAAVEAVTDAFAPMAGALSLEMSGVGVFGVELQKTIRAEAQKRSILASAALLLVLFAFFRKLRYLFVAAMPIGMGFLCGLAVVSLLFDTVHGITLAFGFTLMGVAIDYPLHLFSHAEVSGGRVAIRRIWPTMRLGAISTAIAYVALAFSGSQGLAQLGVFTAAGVAVALFATRAWVPYFAVGGGERVPGTESPVPLRLLPAVGLAGIAIVAISQVTADGLWDDRLTSLSPVPEVRLADDIRLRSAAGTPDMRYQLFIHNASLDDLLSRTEDVDKLLGVAANDGLVESWRSLTQVWPSAATQATRQANVPRREELAARLSAALEGTPFRANAFDAFLDNAVLAAALGPLGPEAFDGTPLQSWRESHLVQLDGQWISLVSLHEPDAEQLPTRIAGWGDDLSFLDLSTSSLNLMRDYRVGALETVGFAALLIVALLWQQRRTISQVLWIALSVVAGLAMTIAVVAAVHGPLTVIHLVGLLLVFGLGLDYVLFLSRAETNEERAATNKAVLACALSTTVAFGVLAGSSIPVLKFLGLTVAAGSASNYLVALAGTRHRVRDSNEMS